MNIFRGQSTAKTGSNNRSGVFGVNNTNLNSASSNSQNRSQLSAGQMFEGEIIDLRNNEVSIKLTNGQIMQAKLQDAVDLYIGLKTSFFVSESNQKQITLKLMPDSFRQTQDIMIDKALQAADLPYTERNYNIINNLINNKMPVDKGMISKFLSLNYAYPDVSVDNLIKMLKNNIPISEGSIEQFNNYQHKEHQILGQINQVTSDITSIINELSNNPDTTKKSEIFNQQLLSLLTETNTKENLMNIPKSQREELIKIFESLDPSMPKTLINSIVDGTALVQDIKEYMANIKSQELPQVINKINTILPEYNDVKSFMTYEERENLVKLMEPLGMKENLKLSILNGDTNSAAILNFIKNSITEKPLDNKVLFVSKEYQTLLRQELISNWTMTPRTIVKEHEIDQFYKKMDEQLSKINALIETVEDTSLNLQKSTNTVKNNIDFMKTLNEFIPYMQIPLKLKNQNTNGELFVYTNKSLLQKNPDDVSVLLHLSMDNLGSVDVSIHLQKKSITSKFYLEDKDSIRIFEEHMDKLKEQLTLKGFVFNAQVVHKEKDVEGISNFLEKTSSQTSSSTSISRYSFDIRA